MFIYRSSSNDSNMLSEAPEDQVSSTTSEPMEKDSGVKSDGDTNGLGGTAPLDLDSDGSNPTEDDDGSADDSMDEVDAPTDELDGDVPPTDAAPEEDSENSSNDDGEDKTKKYRLMQDYRSLLDVSEELKDGVNRMDISEFSDREKEVYTTLISSLNDSLDKLEYTMTSKFKSFEYVKLLTIFLHLKTSIIVVSDVLKKLVKL